MQLIVNGQDREFASPQTVASLLEAMGYGDRRVAVEVNREIVPRSQHPLRCLSEGDRVEIIHAMGGG